MQTLTPDLVQIIAMDKFCNQFTLYVSPGEASIDMIKDVFVSLSNLCITHGGTGIIFRVVGDKRISWQEGLPPQNTLNTPWMVRTQNPDFLELPVVFDQEAKTLGRLSDLLAGRKLLPVHGITHHRQLTDTEHVFISPMVRW